MSSCARVYFHEWVWYSPTLANRPLLWAILTKCWHGHAQSRRQVLPKVLRVVWPVAWSARPSVSRLLGFPDQARLRCDQAVQVAYKLFEQSFDLIPVANALDFTAMVYSYCRDAQAVQRLGQDLLELATKYDFPFYLRAGQMYCGWALAHQGEASAGAAMIRANVEQHRREGIRKFEPYWRSLLAEALALAGQSEEALGEVEAGLAFAEETQNRYWNAHLLKLKADYLLAQSASADEVAQWYERAVTTAHQQGARSLELRATISLCKLWQTQGKTATARSCLTKIYEWFTEGFDTPDLQEAGALLAELA